jgi:N-methylhydantoinase A/oxoprolinase/acetone carboxylase beta subunit
VDIGVDVGGTFTDFVGFRGRDVVTLKLPTTKDPADAVSQGMRSLGARGLAHGTTVATKITLALQRDDVLIIETPGGGGWGRRRRRTEKVEYVHPGD